MLYDTSAASVQPRRRPLRRLGESPDEYQARCDVFAAEEAVEEARRAAAVAPYYVDESDQLVGPRPDARYVGAPGLIEDCPPDFAEHPWKYPGPVGNGIPEGCQIVDELVASQHCPLPTSQVLPRGQLVGLLGPPKVGKTLVAHELGARLSRGEPVLDLMPKGPSRTMIVAGSEGGELSDHWPRLRAANADSKYVTVISNTRLFIPTIVDVVAQLSLPHDLARIERAITRMRPGVLVVNTLRSLADDPSQELMMQILDRLSEIAQRGQLTCLLVDFNDNSVRSQLVAQRARVVLDLAKEPDGVTRRLRVKYAAGSPIEGKPWRFTIDGDDSGVPRISWLAPGETVDPRTRRGPAPRQDIAAWLQVRLGTGGASRETIITEGRAAGFPEISIDRAFRRTGGKSVLAGDGTNRRIWRLP